MNPVRAGLATILISLRRPPARASISAHSAAVRWSFHSSARRITRLSLVEKDRAVHLARQTDRGHVGRSQLGLFDHGPNGRGRGPPPIVGILLAPGGLGVIDRDKSSVALARIVPDSSMARVFVPEVPMSMPRKWLMEVVPRRAWTGSAMCFDRGEQAGPPQGARANSLVQRHRGGIVTRRSEGEQPACRRPRTCRLVSARITLR